MRRGYYRTPLQGAWLGKSFYRVLCRQVAADAKELTTEKETFSSDTGIAHDPNVDMATNKLMIILLVQAQ